MRWAALRCGLLRAGLKKDIDNVLGAPLGIKDKISGLTGLPFEAAVPASAPAAAPGAATASMPAPEP